MKLVKIDAASYDCVPEIQSRIRALPRFELHSANIHGHAIEVTLGMSRADDATEIMHTVQTVLGALLPHSKCDTFAIPITIFFTDHKKILPHSGPIGQINVNTGYASPCGRIVVYRAEEWCKVFIHECFHFFKLDHNLETASMQTMFPIAPRIRLCETFSEVWARILNCGMRASTVAEVDTLLRRERAHSIYQLVKVLDYNGLTYDDVLRKSASLATYRENTNVFAYIVLGAMLMFEPRKFMAWSGTLRAPTTPIYALLDECAHAPSFIQSIKAAERVCARDKAARAPRYVSMRMSCVE